MLRVTCRASLSAGGGRSPCWCPPPHLGTSSRPASVRSNWEPGKQRKNISCLKNICSCLSPVEELDLDVAELARVPDVVRPVLVTLDAVEAGALRAVGQHHHHLDQSEVSTVVTWPVSTNHSSPGPRTATPSAKRRGWCRCQAPGPIRCEYYGHVTRSPPITAHLGRDVLPPAAGEHVRHERGVDVVARSRKTVLNRPENSVQSIRIIYSNRNNA